VAFSILAVSATVLMRVFATGLRGMTSAEAYSQAVFHAESLLARMGQETPLQVGVQENGLGDGYHGRRIVRPYRWAELPEDVSLPFAAFEVIVEVSWEDPGRRRSVTLRSLRLKPVKRSEDGGADDTP
jgi:hypothetical protein